MKKLVDLLNRVPCDGDVGIEIECEGDKLQVVESDVWRTEADGSLRGAFPQKSCEWVMCQPVKIGKMGWALEQLFSAQAEGGAKFNFSFRTSVHVHVNVQQLTKDQAAAMAYAYYLIEDVMMEYCAEHRRSNRFCLRLADAEGAIPYLRKFISINPSDLRRWNPENQIRYSSLNLEALWKYGSIEFRGLEGTSDVERISTWAKALFNLRKFALSVSDIRDVYNIYLKTGAEDFLDTVLADESKHFKCKDFERMIRKGFSVSMELPFSYKPYPPEAFAEVNNLFMKNNRIDAFVFNNLPADIRINPVNPVRRREFAERDI